VKTIRYIERSTGEEKQEKVYGGFFIRLLYSSHLLSRIIAHFIVPLISFFPFPSKLYGALQKTRWSRWKINRFIKKFHVDPSEFQDPITSFKSFNDFFIRKLKSSCRPFSSDEQVAILPADARYLVFPSIDQSQGFFVKGKKFSLSSLVQDAALAKQFAHGSMVVARLAPVDYHRFHFCCDGLAHAPQLVPGHLYSVNPLALQKHSEILAENKRMITRIETSCFDLVLSIEVGATYVGTIHQTFPAETFQKKGAEKGYFSFGGSCLILLFKPHVIQLDQDLVDASLHSLETLGKLGQSLGRSLL
jgi:phosphatidylserine decarboxylase